MTTPLTTSKRPVGARNGKIELLRFVFCIVVLLYHCGKDLLKTTLLRKGGLLTFFSHGTVGVEFFFLVSGYLMAKSVYKKVKAEDSPITAKALSEDYAAFMKHKYLGIFPQHIIGYIIVFLCYVFSKSMGLRDILIFAFKSLPTAFLVQMSGIVIKSPNHIEWYISCMLLSMAVIYPLLRRYYYVFTRCFAPVFSLLILGFMMRATGGLSGVKTWMCYKALLRAFSELCVGTVCFEIARAISEKRFSVLTRTLLTAVEAGCVLFALAFSVMKVDRSFEFYVLFGFAVVVTLAFSGVTYGRKLFDNRVCCYLGSLSLPVYVGQLGAIYLGKAFMKDMNEWTRIILVVLISFAFAFIIKYTEKLYRVLKAAYLAKRNP